MQSGTAELGFPCSAFRFGGKDGKRQMTAGIDGTHDIKQQISWAEDERLDHVNENLTLIQKKHGLTYGTDAFLLAAFVRAQKNSLCVDLGSGTGVIPLLLLTKEKVRNCVAVEIQPCFASLIERNAQLNGLPSRLHAYEADIRTVRAEQVASLFETNVGGVDVVTANPPYMKNHAGARNRCDEKYMARHEVAGNIEDFCACAARLLRSGGLFYCVWRPDRISELMQALSRHRLEVKRMVFVHADAESEPSVVLLESKLDGAPSCRLLPPLLLHETGSRTLPHRPLTQKAQRIYDTMQWDERQDDRDRKKTREL